MGLPSLHRGVRSLLRGDSEGLAIELDALSPTEREVLELLRQRLQAIDGRVENVVPRAGAVNWMAPPIDARPSHQ